MIVLWLATGVLAKPSGVEPIPPQFSGGYFSGRRKRRREEKLEAVEEAIEQVIEAAPKKPSRNYVIESLTAIHQRHQFSEIVAAAQYMQAEMQTRKQQTFLRALLEHARLLQEEEEAVTLLLLH
jgi:hypothetical protein